MPAFSVVRLNSAALVWAGCPLGGGVAPELYQVLTGLVDEGATPIVLDLVHVPAIDDGVVAVFAAAALRLGHHGRGLELRLAGNRSVVVRDAAQLRSAIGGAYPTAA